MPRRVPRGIAAFEKAHRLLEERRRFGDGQTRNNAILGREHQGASGRDFFERPLKSRPDREPCSRNMARDVVAAERKVDDGRRVTGKKFAEPGTVDGGVG